MEILRKFASRKFIAAAATFAMSIAAVILGEGNEWIQIAGAVGAIIAPTVYMFVEAWVDGKAVAVVQEVPSFAIALYNLIDVFEMKYGASKASDLAQALLLTVAEQTKAAEAEEVK